MKILLIFPPQAQPFLPHLALPSLAGALKAEGFDVTLRDYNLESYEYFLSPDKLKDAGVPEFIANQSEAIRKSLRTGFDYFLPSNYYSAIETLEEYLKHICRKYNDVSWTLKDYSTAYSPFSSDDIKKAVADRRGNLFIEFFERKMPEIKEFNPSLIGISVAWSSQIIPAFTLSHMIKKSFPHIHVTLGGSMISHLSEFLKYKRSLFRMVDSFLPYEGEIGIVEVARGMETENHSTDIENRKSTKNTAKTSDKCFPACVPGLIYLDGKKIKSNDPKIPNDLEDLPVPDFSDLSLSRYYSPQVYLPISASRGCYWGKCAFCTHHISGSQFRQRKTEDIFAEMNSHFDKYGCKNFYFVDDAFPPALAANLAELISESKLPFRWMAEFRAEKTMDRQYFQILFKGGCRMALFGLESYCQETIDRMRKGWDKNTIAQVIRDCSEAGIITWVFFMLGFPGEKRAQAMETLKFIIDNRKYIDMIAGGVFILTKDSAVYKNPGEFSIEFSQKERITRTGRINEPYKEEDLKITFQYSLKEGLQRKEAEELLVSFRKMPETQKFLKPFVAESHLLFFRKGYFEQK